MHILVPAYMADLKFDPAAVETNFFTPVRAIAHTDVETPRFERVRQE